MLSEDTERLLLEFQQKRERESQCDFDDDDDSDIDYSIPRTSSDSNRSSDSEMSLRRSVLGSLKNVPHNVQVRFRTASGQSFLLPPPPLCRRPGFSHQDEKRPPIPGYERSVDLSYCDDFDIDEVAVFNAAIVPRCSFYRSHQLFELPPNVRHKIFGYCFPDETRKITLSPRFATKAVFPEDFFANPWQVLDDVWGGLASFRAMRHELLAYFWTQFSFHVTITPFNGPQFSPLSHIWLQENLAIVQKLTVEVDYTRFGGSVLRLAPNFGINMVAPFNTLSRIVAGLTSRSPVMPMAKFHMMCRRYVKMHPNRDSITSDDELVFDPLGHCPDYTLFLCKVLSDLRGVVQEFRVSGYTQDFSELLLLAVFDVDDDEELPYSIPEQSPWPDTDNIEFTTSPLPNSPNSVLTPWPALDTSENFNAFSPIMHSIPVSSRVYDEPSSINAAPNSTLLPASSFGLTLTRSRSFQEAFEEEIRNSSLNSELNEIDTSHRESTESTDTLVGDTGMNAFEDSMNIAVSSNSEEINQPKVTTLSTSISATSGKWSISGRYSDPFEDSPPDTSTSILSVVTLHPIENNMPKQPDRLAPGLPARCPIPKSPHSMNQLNEQDPAFLRTLNALRQTDSTPTPRPGATRTVSEQNSVPRSLNSEKSSNKSSSSLSRSFTTIKKYSTFMGRFRGRSG